LGSEGNTPSLKNMKSEETKGDRNPVTTNGNNLLTADVKKKKKRIG
jgi:hypothetical protein